MKGIVLVNLIQNIIENTYRQLDIQSPKAEIWCASLTHLLTMVASLEAKQQP